MSYYSSTNDAVESINTLFASFLTTGPSPACDDSSSEWNPVFEIHAVERVLLSLKPDKAAGCDQIPTTLYRSAAHILAAPLAHIFNLSIRSRKVPDAWKLSHITPVPKSSPPKKNELRPISLLPIPAKVFERLILDSGIRDTLVSCFGNNQFGGRPKSSTTLALIAIHDRITYLLDRPETSGAAILAYDFSKAFDQLGHKIIIDTMIKLHLPLGFIQWTVDYLRNRLQAVRIHCCVSSPIRVTSGIPQGSLLGPYLFNIVVGTLHASDFESRIIKYIDDCTFIVPLLKSGRDIIRVEHSHMLEWSETTKLKVNVDKTKCMFVTPALRTITPTLPSIKIVQELKLLGVVFTSNLKWEAHVKSTVRTASQRLYVLRLLRSLVSRDDLFRIYFGVVRSILEYASPVFIGMLQQDSVKLERVQRRAHRIICGENCNCSVLSLLSDRRILAAVNLLEKCCKPDHLLYQLCPQKSVRSSRFIQPPSRTQRRLSSFFPLTVFHANSR